MGRSRDDSKPELFRNGADFSPLPSQFLAHLRNVLANLGGRFHLCPHQLVYHLAGNLLLAGRHESIRRIYRQLKGFGVNQEVFLLHTQSEAGLFS